MGRNRDSRGKRAGGFTLLVVGICLMSPLLLHQGSAKGMIFAGLICTGLGLIGIVESFAKSRRLPKKELMRLAEQHHGILTLSEVATGLDVEPDLARRTLQALSKDGIARQRWEEFRQNLWEFPDYIRLPITETLALAQKSGGRVRLKDLLAQGHSLDTAQQTLDTLAERGLARQDPATAERTLILETQ